eukprot:11829_1
MINNPEQEPLNNVVVIPQQQNAEAVVVLPMEPNQPEQIVFIQQPQPVRQQVIIQQPPEDDPTCLYVCACFAFFFPLIGLLAMCCYGCGSNLGARQRQAFTVLVIATVIGMLVNIITGIVASDPYQGYDDAGDI